MGDAYGHYLTVSNVDGPISPSGLISTFTSLYPSQASIMLALLSFQVLGLYIHSCVHTSIR